MGTRSFVGVMMGDICRAVYVHWDGYLEGVGADLQRYKTQEDVEELISHGDRSSLESDFYKDRGEEWDSVRPANYYTFADFYDTAYNSGAEYYYIFRDGVWFCGNTYDGSPLCKTLHTYEQALAVEAIEDATRKDPVF